MNESYNPVTENPAADSPGKKAVDIVDRAKESVLTRTREQPAAVLSGAFVATVIICFLIGYWRGRVAEASKRQRFFEQLIPELTKWMKQHGRRLAEPIKEGIEATRSAAEDVSRSGADLQRRLRPIIDKQKRRFVNLF